MRGTWTTLVVAAALAAGAAAAAEPRSRLVIEESVFDFGVVDQGAKVEHTFQLANRGDGELRIDHVKSTCGCTVGVVSAREVPPGGTGRVTVTLDTDRLVGHSTKVVTVYTSDPDAPAAALTLTGQVSVDLVMTPNPLYLGRLRRGDLTRREVLITPGREGATYAVTAVEHPNPALHTTLEARTDGPGQRLLVELDPGIPLGRFNEQVTLRTTSPRQAAMVLPVFGSVEGDVVVLPPQVTFGIARSGTTAERELVIRNRGTAPLAVTRVSVPPNLATYRLDAVQEGREYRLAVRLRDDLPPGKVEGSVEIFTDNADEPHLVVPLYAIVRGGRRQG